MGKSDYVFRYRVRNWPEYNRALVRRGSLTLWVDNQAIQSWRHVGAGGRGGRPRVYADTAIECALVVKAVFHLSLRATQGFLESVMKLMAVDLPVPDYSTVSRRQESMNVRMEVGPGTRPRHVVIDSTGLKVYGAGEWHIRKHRCGRRRVWRKLHLGVDECSKEIVAIKLTTSRIHDGLQLPGILANVPGQIAQVSADRAYDTERCYECILDRGAAATIPPRRTVRQARGCDPPPWRIARDRVIRQIKEEGRYVWRQSSGATRQSLAENAVSRFKAMLGPKLSARGFENQKTEAAIKCEVLNRMAALGLPQSERILQS